MNVFLHFILQSCISKFYHQSRLSHLPPPPQRLPWSHKLKVKSAFPLVHLLYLLAPKDTAVCYLHKYLPYETTSSLRYELSLSWPVQVRIMSCTTSAAQKWCSAPTQQYHPHLGIGWKCKFSDWSPFPLNRKLWMWVPVISALASHPGNSNAH